MTNFERLAEILIIINNGEYVNKGFMKANKITHKEINELVFLGLLFHGRRGTWASASYYFGLTSKAKAMLANA